MDLSSLSLLPPAEVGRITGFGRTKRYEEIKDGIFPPPISPGERPSLFPRHEIELITQARMAGLSDDDRCALVREMKARRNYADYQQAVLELREFFTELVVAANG